MSYDLMVLDKHKRFERKEDFLNWYNKVTEWEEDLDYNDYRHATPELQSWFLEMKDIFPPINGEFAPSDDEVDEDEHWGDYSIAKETIYCAFAWSDAGETYEKVYEMAKKHDVALYDPQFAVLYYPDGNVMNLANEPDASKETTQESYTKKQTSSSYQKYNFGEKYVVPYIETFVYYGLIVILAAVLCAVSPDRYNDIKEISIVITVIIAVSILIMFGIHMYMRNRKDYIFLDCEGVHVKRKNAVTHEREEGCIPWKFITKCEKVSSIGDFLNIYLKNGKCISLSLEFFYFSKKTFFAAVDYYSSMANACVENNCSSCIEKSSCIDWKRTGYIALGMLMMCLLKFLCKIFIF